MVFVHLIAIIGCQMIVFVVYEEILQGRFKKKLDVLTFSPVLTLYICNICSSISSFRIRIESSICDAVGRITSLEN